MPKTLPQFSIAATMMLTVLVALSVLSWNRIQRLESTHQEIRELTQLYPPSAMAKQAAQLRRARNAIEYHPIQPLIKQAQANFAVVEEAYGTFDDAILSGDDVYMVYVPTPSDEQLKTSRWRIFVPQGDQLYVQVRIVEQQQTQRDEHSFSMLKTDRAALPPGESIVEVCWSRQPDLLGSPKETITVKLNDNVCIQAMTGTIEGRSSHVDFAIRNYRTPRRAANRNSKRPTRITSITNANKQRLRIELSR